MLFEDLPALFGSPLPKDGLLVRAEYWNMRRIFKNTSFSASLCFCVCVCEREFWLFPVHLMAAVL